MIECNGHVFEARGNLAVCPTCGLRYRREYDHYVLHEDDADRYEKARTVRYDFWRKVANVIQKHLKPWDGGSGYFEQTMPQETFRFGFYGDLFVIDFEARTFAVRRAERDDRGEDFAAKMETCNAALVPLAERFFSDDKGKYGTFRKDS